MAFDSILDFPIEDGEAITIVPPPIADTIQNAFFGVDLHFDDLAITPKGDWLTVSGLENLRRSIIRRMLVKPGEFKIRPQYGVGIGSYLKKAMSKSTLDSLKNSIITQLSRERRIRSVSSVELTPTSFGNSRGLKIRIIVDVLGQLVRFKPFTFSDVKA